MSRRKQAKPRACLKRKLGASGQWSVASGQDLNPQVATDWHGLHFHILCAPCVSVCVCVLLIDLLW